VNIAKCVLKDFSYKKARQAREKIYKELSGSIFDRQVKYDIKTYLPELCIRQDKMTMAHSVENRVPFLDYQVVEYSFTIAEQFLVNKKFHNGTGKALVKEIAADVFDTDFAFRAKCGFGLPLKDLFMDKEMIKYLHDVILPSIKRRGIMNYELITKWVNNIPKMDFAELECSLWIVVVFEVWAMQYLD
jgi:asparagine synthase (glutamine-hydrolysing)